MPNEKNLQELFHETLKDIYFAEKKILSALPKMAKAAQSQSLRAAFEKKPRPRRKSMSHGLKKCLKKLTRHRAEKPAMRSWASSRKAGR
jgi:ferritin-like metal-binding protein YciE